MGAGVRRRTVEAHETETLNTLDFPKVAQLNGALSVENADPIYAALADYRRQEKRHFKLMDDLHMAQIEAQVEHGKRPCPLIAWRKFSAIGHDEIERARDEFLLAAVADPQQIESEYQAAKAREIAQQQAGKEWDKRAVLAKLRQEQDQCRRADHRALLKLAKTMPTTAAGAAAFLAYVKTNIAIGEADWHLIAMDTIVRSLKAIDSQKRIAA